MKKRILWFPALPLAAFAITLAIGAGAASADKPDFSGEWKLNLEKSDFGPLPGPKSRVDKISHKDPELKINRTQVSPMDQTNTSEWTCTTDDKECSNDIPGGITLKSTARWDGEKLVVVSKGSFQQGEIRIKDTWTLSKDGKTITIVRLLSSDMGEAEQTLILEKQ
jgi:hypothetical protein